PHYSHLVRWRSTARLKRLFSSDTRDELARYSSNTHLAEALHGLKSDWDPLSQAQFIESRLFMSQYLLSSQGDRVAMAHAVEGRFPFLDVRLLEFCNGLDPRLKLRVLREKHLLKEAARPWLPEVIRQRPKRPYRAPVHRCFFN